MVAHNCSKDLYHSLLCFTLRAAVEEGFLMTIHNIIDVANDREYLKM